MPTLTLSCPSCGDAIQPEYANIASGMTTYCQSCDAVYNIILWPAGPLSAEHLAIIQTLTGALVRRDRPPARKLHARLDFAHIFPPYSKPSIANRSQRRRTDQNGDIA